MSFVKPRSCGSLLGLVLLTLTGVALSAPDQDVDPGSAADSIEVLESRRTAVETDATVPEQVKAGILELLTRAQGAWRQAGETASKTAALAARIAAAPRRIKELEDARDNPPAKFDPSTLKKMDLDELTGLSRESQGALQEARDNLTAREQELAALTALGPTLSDDVTSRKQKIRDLKRGGASPLPDEIPAAAQARSAYARALEALFAAEITHLELQLVNYELLIRLATLERDAAALQESTLDARHEELVAPLELRRAEQAREGLEEAQITEARSASLPEALATLGAENAQLREELESVTLATGTIAEQLRSVERRQSELEAELVSIQERVAAVGPTGAIGRLLTRRLSSLSDIYTDRLRGLSRSSEIVRATDRRIDLGEQRRDLTETDQSVDSVLERIPEEVRKSLGDDWLRSQASDLITTKRATFDKLHEAYARYLTRLTGVDAVERQIATTAKVMRGFIKSQLLWTQTLPPVSLSDFEHTLPTLSQFFERANWEQAATDLRAAVELRPIPAMIGLFVVTVLLLVRTKARRRLAALSGLTGRIGTDAFRHTVNAFLLTILIAAAWPAVLAYLGLLMGTSPESAPFTRHISGTLVRLSTLLVIFSANRWLIHYNGLARSHFLWPEPVRVVLRREFNWLMPVAMLCVTLGVYGGIQGTTEARVGLGRPALMLFLAAFAIFFWRLFRRESAVMHWLRQRHPTGFVVRTWMLWFTLIMLIPLTTIAAAAAGYHDAATIATQLLIDTGWLMIAVLVLRGVMLRWFTVSERRLRYEQALKQRDDARVEREKKLAESDDVDPPVEMAEVEIPQIDFRELGSQGRSMVQVVMLVGLVLSLYAIWSALLPALDVLSSITLPMTRSLVVDGVEQQVAVTLVDAMIALMILAVTLFAAKNLSGVLGFTLLRHMAGDAGVQYAIVTLCQYTLVAAGVLYAFDSLGVQWSKLQWLVAALGVGLGFGLQEIVANFVSGIILLLERPIRVGDIVTVGDATGRVTRIRIRATTIVDWDRKELVVPNKEFITGRLLNWTLTNDVIRLIIPVGIAYGSDARRARELLEEAAIENDHVLEDPAPLIVFDSFGDNALGLELRVYLSSMAHWLPAKTALHDAIYEKLNAAGIAIAFPQRDVHLDTNGPLDIRLHEAGDAGRGSGRSWRGWRRS